MPGINHRPANRLVERLRDPRPLVGVEMRPPRADLSYVDSMDTWIDMHHSIRKLLRDDTVVFLTDNAVGQSEEENLQHLTTNLADEVDSTRVVPFLTCKHTLDYCLMYATRAASHGIESLTVLGGDKLVGPPRCVPHASDLRSVLHQRLPSLTLGGWANPHHDVAEQVSLLLEGGFGAEFFLTQIVSHHSIAVVERFVSELVKQGVPYPAIFGVFLYRSPNPKTLKRLSEFFPVPADGIIDDFNSGLSAEAICARTIKMLREVGANHVYVSNLGFRGAERRYRRVLEALEDS